MSSPIVFDVLGEVIGPIRAKAGDRVVVRREHATAPVAIVRRIEGEWTFLRLGEPDYPALGAMEQAGLLKRIHGEPLSHSLAADVTSTVRFVVESDDEDTGLQAGDILSFPAHARPRLTRLLDQAEGELRSAMQSGRVRLTPLSIS